MIYNLGGLQGWLFWHCFWTLISINLWPLFQQWTGNLELWEMLFSHMITLELGRWCGILSILDFGCVLGTRKVSLFWGNDFEWIWILCHHENFFWWIFFGIGIYSQIEILWLTTGTPMCKKSLMRSMTNSGQFLKGTCFFFQSILWGFDSTSRAPSPEVQMKTGWKMLKTSRVAKCCGASGLPGKPSKGGDWTTTKKCKGSECRCSSVCWQARSICRGGGTGFDKRRMYRV